VLIGVTNSSLPVEFLYRFVKAILPNLILKPCSMPLEQPARGLPARSLAWPPNSVSTTNAGNIVLPKDPTDLLQGLVEQVRDNHLLSAEESQPSAISHRTVGWEKSNQLYGHRHNYSLVSNGWANSRSSHTSH